MVEARKAGLILNDNGASEILGKSPSSPYQSANTQYPVHDTLTGLWKLMEFVPKPYYDSATHKTSRRANLFRSRQSPPDALVHESAQMRGSEYCKRLPPGVTLVHHESL